MLFFRNERTLRNICFTLRCDDMRRPTMRGPKLHYSSSLRREKVKVNTAIYQKKVQEEVLLWQPMQYFSGQYFKAVLLQYFNNCLLSIGLDLTQSTFRFVSTGSQLEALPEFGRTGECRIERSMLECRRRRGYLFTQKKNLTFFVRVKKLSSNSMSLEKSYEIGI